MSIYPNIYLFKLIVFILCDDVWCTSNKCIFTYIYNIYIYIFSSRLALLDLIYFRSIIIQSSIMSNGDLSKIHFFTKIICQSNLSIMYAVLLYIFIIYKYFI